MIQGMHEHLSANKYAKKNLCDFHNIFNIWKVYQHLAEKPDEKKTIFSLHGANKTLYKTNLFILKIW